MNQLRPSQIEVFEHKNLTSLYLADFLSAIGTHHISIDGKPEQTALFIRPFDSDMLMGRIVAENKRAKERVAELKNKLKLEKVEYDKKKSELSTRELAALNHEMERSRKSSEQAIRIAEMIFVGSMARPDRLAHACEYVADAPAHELWHALPGLIKSFEEKAKVFFEQILAEMIAEGLGVYKFKSSDTDNKPGSHEKGGAYIVGNLQFAASIVKKALAQASEQARVELEAKKEADNEKVEANWAHVADKLGKREIKYADGKIEYDDFRHDITDPQTRSALGIALKQGIIDQDVLKVVRRLTRIKDQVPVLEDVLGINRSSVGDKNVPPPSHPLRRLLLEGGASKGLIQKLDSLEKNKPDTWPWRSERRPAQARAELIAA